MLADATRMRADLVAEAVLLLGDVAGLFQQRQVDVAFDVALSAGISIPVPGAAEVAALLDDADILDPGLAQTRRGQEAAEAAADDHHVDRVGERLAGEAGLDVRIVDIVAEVGGDLDVLVIGRRGAAAGRARGGTSRAGHRDRSRGSRSWASPYRRHEQRPMRHSCEILYADCQLQAILVFLRLAHYRRFLGVVLFVFIGQTWFCLTWDAMAHRCNNRHYLPVFTKSKIWSVSRLSAVLIE